jgi:hypothetical protein
MIKLAPVHFGICLGRLTAPTLLLGATILPLLNQGTLEKGLAETNPLSPHNHERILILL